MAKETFYRFELAFSGEPQDVGILQGLEDTPISFPVSDEIYRMFDSLSVPEDLETSDGSAVVCWFTKKGLSQFADAINAMIWELEPFDWQVIGKSADLDPQYAIYQDDLQIAFSRTDLLELTFFDKKDYEEVVCINSDQENPIQFSSLAKPSLFSQIQFARGKSSNLSSENNSQKANINDLSR